MSTEYSVTWKIDVDAVNPTDAARQALMIMRDKKSIATVFEVVDQYTGVKQTIDLEGE